MYRNLPIRDSGCDSALLESPYEVPLADLIGYGLLIVAVPIISNGECSGWRDGEWRHALHHHLGAVPRSLKTSGIAQHL